MWAAASKASLHLTPAGRATAEASARVRRLSVTADRYKKTRADKNRGGRRAGAASAAAEMKVYLLRREDKAEGHRKLGDGVEAEDISGRRVIREDSQNHLHICHGT